MAIYPWPDSRAFVPATAELRTLHPSQRTAESPLSGYMQTVGMPGSRWVWQYAFAPQSSTERARLEALLVRLAGREHRVSLWDHKRPRPRGVVQLSGVTLGAAAPQFATSLQLAGCRGANALVGGNFESDSNGDGVSDGWQRYTAGTVVSPSAVRSTGGTLGTYTQLCQAAGMGTTAGDQQGVWQTGVPVAALAGSTVTASAQVYGSGGTGRLYAEFLNAGASVVGTLNATLSLSGLWQVLSVTGVVPATAVTASVYVWQQAVSGLGPHFIFIDEAQLRAGASVQPYPGVPTLLAGDWLGLASGQLLMVAADAQATDAGVMTVEVRHMLRGSVAAGTAVVLDKPAANYVLAEPGLLLPRQAGAAEPGMAVEFVEVWS